MEVQTDDVILDAFVFGTCAERVTGLNSLNADQLLIYPNPAGSEVHISSPAAGIHAIKIVDISGRLVLSYASKLENSVTIGLEELGEGLYFMIVNTEIGDMNHKLMINR